MDWFSWLSKTSLDPSLVYDYGLAFARNELHSDDLAYFNHEFLQSMGISVAKHRLEILKLARKDAGGHTPRSLSGLILAFNKTRRRLNKYITKWVSTHDTPAAIKAAPPEIAAEPYREQWKGGLLRKLKSEKDLRGPEEPNSYKPKKRIALSGPLNGKVQERLVGHTRSLKLSGPLDGKVQERLMFTDRSPRFPAKMNELRLSGPLDGKLFLTNRSPKLSGPLDGRMMMVPTAARSPKLSGPLDGRALSPMGYHHGNGDFDDHLIWAALFDDMKPT